MSKRLSVHVTSDTPFPIGLHINIWYHSGTKIQIFSYFQKQNQVNFNHFNIFNVFLNKVEVNTFLDVDLNPWFPLELGNQYVGFKLFVSALPSSISKNQIL